MVIVNEGPNDPYDAIRKFYSHDRPIPCQIVRAATLTKAMGKPGLGAAVHGIVEQIQSKLGGNSCSLLVPEAKVSWTNNKVFITLFLLAVYSGTELLVTFGLNEKVF